MPSDINSFCEMLSKTGQFDKLEVSIIRAMLLLKQRGFLKNTANLIAKDAGMSVTNAYKYLYSLQEKGVVESSKEKNKVFWLSQSSNPFPRVFSYVGKDYLEKRRIFSEIQKAYESFVNIGSVWGGEKIAERYEGDFDGKAAFVMDIAKDEILISSSKIYEDFLFLDALKRAAERKVKIRMISEEIDPKLVGTLKNMGVEIKLGLPQIYAIVVDSQHGITRESENGGTWFFNYKSDYKNKFEDLWKSSQSV